MHTHVSWWTQESINWFVRASERTDYHSRLCDEIQSLIPQNESILEFGCGLGYESEILKGKGYEINSYDIDENVVELARKRTGLDIFHQGDVNRIQATADALLCINYGHIESTRELDGLLSHAKRRLVYIISRHNAHGTDTREDRTENMRTILKESKLNCSEKQVVLQFDQPLVSLDEARSFIEWTYLGRNTERYMQFVERADDEKYPFVFRNRKELVLFLIEKTEENI